MEPAIRVDRLPGGRGVVEILAEDVRPPDEDLAVRCDADLRPGERFPYGAELVPLDAVDRRHRRGLREPVPLEDENADGVQELRDFPGQGRPPRDEEAQPSAHPRPDLPEDQTVGDPVFQGEESPRLPAPLTAPRRIPADPEGPLEDRLRKAPVLLDLRQHAGVELLVETWDAHHDFRTDRREILRYRLEGTGEGGDGHRVEGEEVLQPPEGMRQGEELEKHRPPGDVDRFQRRRHVEGVVAVARHDPFRWAGGAGGVDDREVIRGEDLLRARLEDPGVPGAVLLPALPQRGEGRGAFLPLRAAGHHHDAREVGQAGPDPRDLVVLRLVLDECGPRARVGQDVFHLVGEVRGVDRHRDESAEDRPDVRKTPFQARRREDRHAVPPRQPERHQPETDLPRRVADLSVRHRRIAVIAGGHVSYRVSPLGDPVQKHPVKRRLLHRTPSPSVCLPVLHRTPFRPLFSISAEERRDVLVGYHPPPEHLLHRLRGGV